MSTYGLEWLYRMILEPCIGALLCLEALCQGCMAEFSSARLPDYPDYPEKIISIGRSR